MTELDEIRQAVRRLCADFPETYWVELEPNGYPQAFVEALTGAGWLVTPRLRKNVREHKTRAGRYAMVWCLWCGGGDVRVLSGDGDVEVGEQPADGLFDGRGWGVRRQGLDV